jgi:uncharacterized protein YceK
MNMHYLIVGAVAVCLLLAGCGQGLGVASPEASAQSNAAGANANPAPLPTGALPALPLLDLPEPRRASLTQSVTLNGTEAWQYSADVQGLGSSLIFEAANQPVWAIFKFGGLMQTDEPQVLAFNLEDEPGLLPRDVYIGVSDYSRQRWHWHDANAPAAQFAIPLQSTLCSPAGNLYVCVLAQGEPLQLHDLSLSFDYFARPPVNLHAGDGSSRTSVELSWSDPDTTYPGGQEFDYDSLVVERAPGQAGPWLEVERVARGTTEYADLSAPGLGPAKLYYRLRIARGENITAPCVPDVGYVDFAPQVTEVAGLPMPGGPFGGVAPAPAYGQLTAQGALDPDGGAVTFEWQFDGGSWHSTGLQPLIFHTFNAYTEVTVRVTDDEGTSNTRDFNQPLLGFAKPLAARGAGGSLSPFTDGMVDQSGNAILTLPQGTGFCKLDPNLNPLWVRAWEIWQLKAGDCAADGSFLGYSPDFMVRFDSAGEPLWVKQLDPSLEALHVKAGPNGRIWVVGKYHASPINSLSVSLLESDGQVVFTRDLTDGPEQQSWHPASCAVNPQGELVVSLSHWFFDVGGMEHDSLLLKILQDGSLAWQKKVSSGLSQIQDSQLAYADSADAYFCVANLGDATTKLFSVSDLGELGWNRELGSGSLSYGKMFYEAGRLFLAGQGLERINIGAGPSAHIESWSRASEGLIGVFDGRAILTSTSLPTANWNQSFRYSSPADLSLSDTAYSLADFTLTWTDVQLEEVTPPVLEVPSEDMALIQFQFGGTPVL